MEIVQIQKMKIALLKLQVLRKKVIKIVGEEQHNGRGEQQHNKAEHDSQV